MPNEPGGAIQVLDNTMEAINQALAQVLERVDDLKGLRGPVTIHDRLSVAAPLDPLDAINLDTLVGDFVGNMATPFSWPGLGNTQRPGELQGEDSQLDAADPLLWLLTDRFLTPEEGLLNPHDPFLWLLGNTAGSGTGTGGQPQNPPPNVAAASAIGAVLDRYAAEDHAHGITTGSFTITGTGFTVDPTGTALYALVGPVVVLFLPALTGTSDATTFTLTGLPAAVTPTRESFHYARVQDNTAAFSVGMLQLTAASTTVTLYTTAAAAAWTAGGTKSFGASWYTYALL